MKKLLLLLAIAATAIVSCKKISGPDAPKDRLKAILLGQDTLQLYVGETRQVPVTLSPSNYGVDSIKWKSSDTTIISITKTGLLTAKKVGSSIISVSNLTNTISVNCLVSVVPAPIDSLKLGLLAYYPFNNSAADMSGNGYNGINNGATPVADRNGVANAAYYFNGTNSNIDLGDVNALRLNNTDYTINVWINSSQLSSDIASVVLCKRSNTAYGYALSITGSLQSRGAGLVSYGPGGGFDSFWGVNRITPGKWYMITIMYSLADHQAKSYINGVYDNESDNSMASPNSDASFYIGSDNPDNGSYYFFNGNLDDIRIYNRKLSANELSKLYQRPN